jgi:hypothetical protein
MANSKPDASIENNVANFDTMISAIRNNNGNYNPTNEDLKIENLMSLSANVKVNYDAYKLAIPGLKNAIAARELAFTALSPLMTKVKNAIISTKTSQQVDDYVKSLVRKILGQRISAKMTEEEKNNLKAAGTEVVEHTSVQMSYENKTDNFDKLIKLLESIPEYKPNEEDLKIPSLKKSYNNLKNLNSAVVEATLKVENARIARNEMFNKADTGLCDIALSIKAYMKSVYGASSKQYKQISSLRFVRIK